jgi:hypothetical protein
VHVDGEIHLRVTLVDGTRSVLPATWTSLFAERPTSPVGLPWNPSAIRELRAMLDPMRSRLRRRGRRRGTK